MSTPITMHAGVQQVWLLSGTELQTFFIGEGAPDVLLSTPVERSDTLYRPIGNAIPYIDYAEALKAKADLLTMEIESRNRMLSDTLAELANVQAQSPAASTIACMATFYPQAWQNDYAVDVDPGPEDFDITDQIELMGREKALALQDNQYETDELREGRGVTQWIRDWPGLFYVRVEDAVREYFEEKDARMEKSRNGLARILSKRPERSDSPEP